MSKNNQKYTVSNPITGKDIEIVYRNGMRLFQFMGDNQLTDEDNSKALLEAVKAKIATGALESITSDGVSKVTKYDENVYFKSGKFHVRGKLTVERGEADEKHVELIREWRNKKALESQKAIERANVAIQELTKLNAKAA
jgi:hypothetical protein